ncbi:hypothetical protein [Vibrio rotiferianus]|uniref:hypothetical protein n=1 Tax=Vibrio rotiferianus TaxID=190895 RepID=UPI0024AF7A0C|nr:hypothetical protein [Vibrio rotiferianus]
MRGQRRGWGMALSAKRRKLFQERISILGLGLKIALVTALGCFLGGAASSG